MCSGDTSRVHTQGVYVVWLYLPQTIPISVGRLGTHQFPAGTYAYCGSAQRTLQSRLRRHAAKEKPLRWHIDYLSVHCDFLGHDSWVVSRAGECRLAGRLQQLPQAHLPLQGFGSSDCRCVSHLVFIDKQPLAAKERSELRTILSYDIGELQNG